MTTETNEIELRKAENGTFEIEKVVKIKDKRQLPKYLDKDIMLQRIEDMPPGRDKMLVITMWRTGCRVSEVLNIKKKDIDFKNRLIKISWLKSRKWHDRIIPLQKGLGNLLAIYCTVLNMEDRLFPYTRQNALKVCKKWL
ncbi:MAG: tyrosine-type recombinase/integrase, partial [Candidatus Heimdallarchaeota archaeon]